MIQNFGITGFLLCSLNYTKFVKTIFSIIMLFTIVSIISITPNIFADHPEVIIEPVAGSGSPGCEQTAEGCYIPSTATVDVGGVIIFSNTDNVAHTFTAGTMSDGPSGEFDTGLLMMDTMYEHSPDKAGEIPYYCIVHPWMVGTIIVQGEATEEEHVEEKVHEATEEEHVEEEVLEAIEEEHVEEEVLEAIEEEHVEEEVMETQTVDGEEGGGCLIATAAYGTELAPQVQFLREIRDNTVMSTASGTSFMTGFNQLYYSFSPIIADMERENPMFQEVVRAFITPMISSLSIMTLAEDGNDLQVLGLGISIITLNLGLYIAAPTVVGFAVSKRLKSRN